MARSLRQGQSREGVDLNSPQAQAIKEQLRQLEGKSQSELEGQLMRAVEQGRKDGTFDNDKLDAFIKTAAPMLNPQQRKRLNEMANRLRG